ncbi:MAG: cupin domain-containing protein [Acidobacteriota bacterium]
MGKKTYCYLAEERPAGEQSCDLMKVDRPANQESDIHPHDDVSELIYIVKGDGEVTIDGHAWKVAGGTAYYTPLGSQMGLATTTETESVVLVVNR